MAVWAGLTRIVAGFEDGGMGPPGKGWWQLPEARKDRMDTSLEPFQKESIPANPLILD